MDLLRLVGVGRFLRWRHARLTLQLGAGALALVIVLHGLFGPKLAPKNLATLLTWVHYRGLLVIALLTAGNLFCMGCPLLLPRRLARRLRTPTRSFPRILRRKWIAAAAFVLVLFAYEAWDLWSDPRWTALLVLGFFTAALAIDASFRGAPFCQYVCPIGQFNFLSSTLSPLEVRAKDAAVCDGCSGKECIRGRREAPTPEPLSVIASSLEDPATAKASPAREAATIVRRGCELGLFLPAKVGNLDCTFCLDCVHACPHDNVALATRAPAEELLVDPVRSGIGRLSKRTDLAVLVVLFTFGALLNAFGMVGPVYALQQRMAAALGTRSEVVVLAVLFVLCLAVLPLAALGATAWTSRRLAARDASPSEESENFGATLRRMSWSLLPLGVGIWTAHYLFHFLTGLWTFVPVAQNALAKLGTPLLGQPDWGRGGLPERFVQPIEMGFLALGLVGSWLVASRATRSRAAFVPWAVLHALLFSAGVWLMSQPMEMRGTFL